jgi:hypothetical protein
VRRRRRGHVRSRRSANDAESRRACCEPIEAEVHPQPSPSPGVASSRRARETRERFLKDWPGPQVAKGRFLCHPRSAAGWIGCLRAEKGGDLRLRSICLAGLLLVLVTAGAQAVTTARRDAKGEAAADSANELASIRLPGGSTKADGDPSVGHVLVRPSILCLKNQVVDHHAFWHVPGKPAAVWSWIRHHPPKHIIATLLESGTSATWSVTFAFANQPTVTKRQQEFTVTAARGGGTAVRADGFAVWERHKGQSPCFSSESY